MNAMKSLRRCAIEGTVDALVELFARSVTAPELQPTQSIAICPVIASSGNPRKPPRALPAAPARAMTEPIEPSDGVVILGRANRTEALRGFQAQ